MPEYSTSYFANYNNLKGKYEFSNGEKNILIINTFFTGFDDPEVIENLENINSVFAYENDEVDISPLLKKLPNGTKFLKIFGGLFNDVLDNLPLGLVELEIVSAYNQPLDMLPASLKILSINSRLFNQTLNNLPLGLEELHFGRFSKFNQPLRNLPQTMKKMTFYTYYPYKKELAEMYPNLQVTYLDW